MNEIDEPIRIGDKVISKGSDVMMTVKSIAELDETNCLNTLVICSWAEGGAEKEKDFHIADLKKYVSI